MSTIARTTTLRCEVCTDGHAIEHKKTGAMAARWRRAANLSQNSLSAGMGITQSFYSALELGNRRWTPDLIRRFENYVIPILNQRGIGADQL